MKNLKSFKESSIQEEYIRVYPIQDESGHWYIIPFDIKHDFLRDLNNEDMTDSGEFSEIYGEYMTGGDLNLIPLYKKIK